MSDPLPAQIRVPTTIRRSLNSRLLALNFALLFTLAAATIASNARAQSEQRTAPTRNRGDYAFVSGSYQGGNAQAVYILDSANEQLLALTWDRNQDRFDIVGFRSLPADGRIDNPPR